MSFALFPLEAEDVDRVDTGEEDNFSQMTEYWKNDPEEQKRTLLAMAKKPTQDSQRIHEQTLSRYADPEGREYSKQFRAAQCSAVQRSSCQCRIAE